MHTVEINSQTIKVGNGNLVIDSTCRRRANREVQTVNWEAGGEGVVERGVKSSLKKAHKPWTRGERGAQTVN